MTPQPIFVDFPTSDGILRVLCRLIAAVIAGGLIGFEREERHHAAGLRTHMLVSLGSALIVLAPQELKFSADVVSRVVQGLVAGIGFLGAGTILKLQDVRQVKGLTTAATIWVTAGIGLTLGMGLIWPAFVAVTLTWFILFVVQKVEPWLDRYKSRDVDQP